MEIREIVLPDSLLSKLAFNQKLLMQELAQNPAGLTSRSLSHKTGISNKSEALKKYVRELLAKHGLEVHTKRIPDQKEWLWSIKNIEPHISGE